MLRVAGGCLLACLAPAAAAELGDSLSLIQAAVQPKKDSAQPKQHAKHRPKYVNTWDNGFDGREFTFSRRLHAVEEGSRAMNVFSRGCESHDEGGDNDCAMTWGTENPGFMGMHLGTGFHSGDKLSLGLRSNALTHNEHETFLANLFDGEDFEMTTTCQFCEGSCSQSYKKLENWLRLEFPTMLDHPEICKHLDEGVPTDYTLWNSTHLPWGPFGNEFNVPWMKIVGDIHERIAIETSTGDKRFDETFSFKVGQGLSEKPLAPSTALLQLEQAQQVEQEHQARGFLSLVRTAVGQTFNRVAWGNVESRDGGAHDAKQDGEQEEGQSVKAQRATRRQLLRKKAQEKKQRKEAQQKKDDAKNETRPVALERSVSSDLKKAAGRLGTFRFKAQVWYLENNGSISFTAPKWCQTTDAKGSFTCAFPFGSPVHLKMSADLRSNIVDGDVIEVKIDPKIGGILGKALSKIYKPLRWVLPACGKPDEVQELQLFDRKLKYAPSKCGEYSLSANLPTYVFDFPNLGKDSIFVAEEMPKSVKMLIPKLVGGLPPSSFQVMLTLKHKDETPLGSMTFDLGLD